MTTSRRGGSSSSAIRPSSSETTSSRLRSRANPPRRPGGSPFHLVRLQHFQGTLTLDTAGTDFDTVLAVYRGSTIGTLTPVAANDDNGLAKTSRISVAIEGRRLRDRDRRQGRDRRDDQPALVVRGRLRPVNDRFANATTLAGLDGEVSGTDRRGGQGDRRAEPRRQPRRSIDLVPLDGAGDRPGDVHDGPARLVLDDRGHAPCRLHRIRGGIPSRWLLRATTTRSRAGRVGSISR